ncbi:MAG: EamA family transporter, partial [bacterium]|nr:EamA family transporter [bacterium]
MPTSRVPASRYAGAIALFVAGGISQYLGAAVAVGVFHHVPAIAVSWWRILFAALVLLAWRRPWRTDRSWWRAAALFGLALAAMNTTFYLAIHHIPLGTAVALEFIGPIAVAALTGRGWAQRTAIVAAGVGVVVIGGLGLDWGEPGTALGLAAALAAGGFWGLYVALGSRLAHRTNGMDALAVGMTAGAIAFLPLAFLTPLPAFTSPGVMGSMLLVALLSSVVPYAVDQVNFGALPPATFAILLALLPATSLVVGALLLQHFPNAFEVLGLGLISVAVLLANLPAGG